LRASGQLPAFNERSIVFVGELALDGRVRPVRGSLNIADEAARKGFEYVIVPRENAEEASAIERITVVPVTHLREVIAFIEGRRHGTIAQKDQASANNPVTTGEITRLEDIRGHTHAKRALVIAAAGHHHVLFHGPPGVGKSMLVQTVAGLLPPLTHEESIEVTKIQSAVGLTLYGAGLIRMRPVRMPHQSISLAALIGGGPEPMPGEISLAHRGVLFLDEFPEFPRHALDALRQPLESRVIHIARAKQRVTFPANFLLIAAMNPCPCGFYGDDRRTCTCSAQQVLQYTRKVSGPLLDRIDLVVRMERINASTLGFSLHASSRTAGAETAAAHEGIRTAREKQRERFTGTAVCTNSDMTTRQIRTHAYLGTDARRFLERTDLHHISPRGYYRLIKVARTIADLEGATTIEEEHLAEAYTYRFRDRLSASI
jgi:magnesium chelatase family protein